MEDGSRSDLWYYVQAVNKEIRNFSTVFLGCNCESYYYVGNKPASDIPIPDKDTEPIYFDNIGGKGFLVSHITNKGQKYIVMASQDPFASQVVSILYNKKYNVYRLTNEKGPDFSNAPLAPLMSYIFKPGGYEIFRYEEK